MPTEAPDELYKGRIITELAEGLALLDKDEWVGIDIETTGLSAWRNRVAVISMYGDKTKIPVVLHTRGDVPLEFVKWASHSSRKFVAHNAVGFDAYFLANAGMDIFTPEWYDTLVGETAILVSGRRDVSASLKATVQRRVGKTLNKGIDHSTWMLPILNEQQLQYVVGDVIYLHKIMKKQKQHADSIEVREALDLEMKLLKSVFRMTLNGLPFNTQILGQYLTEQLDATEQAQKDLFAIFGRINLNSPKQLKEALSAVGINVESTAVEVLKERQRWGGEGKEVLDRVLQFRHGNQRLKMYSSSFLERFVFDDWIHARFWQVGTDTGRFSSSDPNLQQVPGDMRHVFRAPDGYKMVSADYSQIEVRAAASIANDHQLLEDLAAGGDIHRQIASSVFGKPQDEISDTERSVMKAGTFTFIFAGGAFTAAAQARDGGADISHDQMKKVYNDFFVRYPDMWDAVTKARAIQQRGGSVTLTMPTGLKRQVAGEHLKATRILNTLIQGTAAAGLKFGLLDLQERGEDLWLGATVHDELVACVPEPDAVDYGKSIEAGMIRGMAQAINAPIKVGVGVGDYWTH